MRACRDAVGVIGSVVLAGVAATGCAGNTGRLANAPSGLGASQTTVSVSAAPTGEPFGSAVMKVLGGNAPVTIRYRINGGPE